MEITVKKEDIVSALNTTLGVVEKRQTLPILANVLFEVDENSFKLTATDLESEVTTSGPLSSAESTGKTTTSAKKLNELCRLIPDGEDIGLSLNSEKLNIKTKNGKLVELALKQSIEGEVIKNLEAIANPDSLKQFKNIKELNE